MIKSCHIQNFRCFRDASFTLGPLTAFVGPNASGKSAILAALNPEIRLSERDVWRRLPKTRAAITTTREDGQRFSKVFHEASFRIEGEAFAFQSLRLDPAGLRTPNTTAKETRLRWDGGNLTNLFASLSRHEQGEVATELGRLVPVLSDVNSQPVGSGILQLVFQDRWRKDVEYISSEVSDGTILGLAFILLGYQATPPDVIAIEEPERGVHPYLLSELVTNLRRLSTGELGKKPVQVVMATHSAELLDLLRPEEVKFLSRDPEDGTVRVEAVPTQAPDWELAFQKYRESLGGVWLSGGLGGVPGG